MSTQTDRAKIVLTGDRPTGPLHLGHYVGSLQNRLKLQDQYKQYVMVADIQAMTDNYKHPDQVKNNVFQVVLDYLAVGLEPEKTTMFIQSLIPALPELTMYYLNLVTVNRLRRNPTVKTEIQQKGFGDRIPAGFLIYPVSQAADITFAQADYVPVGEDQLPMIEQTNEIVRSFNHMYNTNVLKEVEALIPEIGRLPGTDGSNKMSKSLGNSIFLSDDSRTLKEKVRGMYTDPDHIRVNDPGKVEGNPVFAYLDAFDTNTEQVAELKAHYRRGGLGDVVLKDHLYAVLESFLDPIRERRNTLMQDPDYVWDVLHAGTKKAERIADQTLQDVKKAMALTYF
jgi:tryptophanyl-tRNA synthetase